MHDGLRLSFTNWCAPDFNLAEERQFKDFHVNSIFISGMHKTAVTKVSTACRLVRFSSAMATDPCYMSPHFHYPFTAPRDAWKMTFHSSTGSWAEQSMTCYCLEEMWVVVGERRLPEKLPEEKQVGVGVVTDLQYPPCLEEQFWVVGSPFMRKNILRHLKLDVPGMMDCELDWIRNQIRHKPLLGLGGCFPRRMTEVEVRRLKWVPRESCTFWQARYKVL